MLKEIYTAAMGMVPQQTRLEVLANNMANASTPGFKRDEVFERNLIDARANFFNVPGDVEQEDPPVGTYTDFAKGAFEQTENKLDLALENPDGFFVLQGQDGNRYYTRAGHFTMTTEGNIITTDGKYLLGADGLLNIKKEFIMGEHNISDEKAVNLKITENGEVFANETEVGNLLIANIPNPESLEKISNADFMETGNTIVNFLPTEEVQVRQGWLENSNVDIIKEMVTMIELQRAFEAGSKVIQTNDGTLDRSIAMGRFY